MEQGSKRLRLPRSGKSIARRVKLISDRLDQPHITSPKEALAWIVLGASGAGGGCGKQLKCIFHLFFWNVASDSSLCLYPPGIGAPNISRIR